MAMDWIAKMMGGEEQKPNYFGALNTPDNFGKLMAPGDIAQDVTQQKASSFPGISKLIASPEFPVALAGLGKLALGAGGVRGQKENTFNDMVYDMALKRSQSAANRKVGTVPTIATGQPAPGTTPTALVARTATTTTPTAVAPDAANSRMKQEQQRRFIQDFIGGTMGR
jgi:hypothetical protein